MIKTEVRTLKKTTAPFLPLETAPFLPETKTIIKMVNKITLIAEKTNTTSPILKSIIN